MAVGFNYSPGIEKVVEKRKSVSLHFTQCTNQLEDESVQSSDLLA